MKERYNKHEIAVIVLFVGILFAMLFGMAAPSVCRRLGISLPGTGKNDAANEASMSAVSYTHLFRPARRTATGCFCWRRVFIGGC